MKLQQSTVRLLWIAFLVLCAIVIVQNTLIIISVNDSPLPGSVAADVNLCINRPPLYLNNITCDTAYTFTANTCNVSAYDPDGSGFSQYTTQLASGNPNGSDLFSNISTDGILYFIPLGNQTGNYTINITANDSANCSLSTTTLFNITVLLANQSPVLVNPIPNSTWNEDTILVPYNLNTYFDDPEGEQMSFRAVGNVNIAITITAAGEVTLNPGSNYCGTEVIQYIATDPSNLTATSNSVTLEVLCQEEEEEQQSSSGGSSGGSASSGGGGGGAAYQRFTCREEKYCYDWSPCQFTEAISQTGKRHELEIEGVRGSRVFIVEDPLTDDTELLYRGFTWRECIDTNKCSDITRSYVRSCEYEPSCFDFIQNQDETSVDCGGVCGPCTSCSDGIQNGLEEGVDCGGPDCEVCHSCTDGIMNGKELAVDCGGPDCDACPNCFDGVQNGFEEGIDCGGNCVACVEEQVPVLVEEDSGVTRILVGAIVAIGLLIVAAVVFKKYLIALLSALALRYKRKNRLIFLSHDAKLRILAELLAIEQQLGKTPTLQLQTAFSRVVRVYFGEAFDLEFEFTYQELIDVLSQKEALSLLQAILLRFFTRTMQLEFSGKEVAVVALSSLIGEFREMIYQTSVLTADDIQRRVQDVAYREIPANVPLRDQAYLLLSNGHLAVEYNKLLTAQQAYQQLLVLYKELPAQVQASLHPDIERFYLELRLAVRKNR